MRAHVAPRRLGPRNAGTKVHTVIATPATRATTTSAPFGEASGTPTDESRGTADSPSAPTGRCTCSRARPIRPLGGRRHLRKRNLPNAHAWIERNRQVGQIADLERHVPLKRSVDEPRGIARQDAAMTGEVLDPAVRRADFEVINRLEAARIDHFDNAIPPEVAFDKVRERFDRRRFGADQRDVRVEHALERRDVARLGCPRSRSRLFRDVAPR